MYVRVCVYLKKEASFTKTALFHVNSAKKLTTLPQYFLLYCLFKVVKVKNSELNQYLHVSQCLLLLCQAALLLMGFLNLSL